MYGKMENKINTSGAPCVWCAISVFHTNGASPYGAPLVYSSGAPPDRCAISAHPIYSPFPSSDALQRASVVEEHRTLMGMVVERVQSVKSGLNEAFTSLLKGFDVCDAIFLAAFHMKNMPVYR